MSDYDGILLRLPKLEDGIDVFRLISNCPPLDTNSSYCNLLQCSHFASTSVAAFEGDSLVGFISGYPLLDKPSTLFIWQVAVSENARGRGLASKMLAHILSRSCNSHFEYLETTITEDNQLSWELFKRFAQKNDAVFRSSEWMDKSKHFAGQHASELLVRIGPFTFTP
ncbi:MAG: diaminobutyrate acetyltransferase [Cellvibrionaceae bacterium]